MPAWPLLRLRRELDGLVDPAVDSIEARTTGRKHEGQTQFEGRCREARPNRNGRLPIGGLDLSIHRETSGITVVVYDPGISADAERLGRELRGTIEELGINSDQHIKDLAVMLNPYAKGGQYERFFSGPNTIDFSTGHLSNYAIAF